MAEQFLDRPQVATLAEQMCCEGMAQCMGCCVLVQGQGRAKSSDGLLDNRRLQGPAPGSAKQGLVIIKMERTRIDIIFNCFSLASQVANADLCRSIFFITSFINGFSPDVLKNSKLFSN